MANIILFDLSDGRSVVNLEIKRERANKTPKITKVYLGIIYNEVLVISKNLSGKNVLKINRSDLVNSKDLLSLLRSLNLKNRFLN